MDANSTNPAPPSMLRLGLWTCLWLMMGFWAIVGPIFVILAVVSFFVDLPVGFTLPSGQEPRTPMQKAAFLALGALIGIVGIGFFWLRRRGYFKDPV